MEQEKVDRIIKLISINLLAWIWLNQQNLRTEYAPPTEEQAIREYQNSPMFHRAVDSMACGIINVVTQPAVQAVVDKSCECGSDGNGKKIPNRKHLEN